MPRMKHSHGEPPGNQARFLPFREIGDDVTIWPLAKIIQAESISIGNSVIIDDFVFLAGGGDTRIGSFVHIACHTSITGGGMLIMEDFSGLSGGVRIYTGNEDYSGACLTNPAVPTPFRVPIRSFVTLRRHAIVGANAVIMPGVDIGEGAVIGANSLVRTACEPWTVHVGSPARPVKKRPSEAILDLEARLRELLFDSSGNYIPRYRRDVV